MRHRRGKRSVRLYFRKKWCECLGARRYWGCCQTHRVVKYPALTRTRRLKPAPTSLVVVAGAGLSFSQRLHASAGIWERGKTYSNRWATAPTAPVRMEVV